MNNEEKKVNNQNSKFVNHHHYNHHHNVVKIPDPNQDFNLQTNTKHKRSNSTTSNLSIIDLNDNDKDNWNFFTSTQNLASVLNDPNVNRTVSEQIFIKDWGSYFNEVNQLSSNLKQFKLKREYIDRFIQNLNKRDKFRKNLNESRIEFYNFKDDDLKDKQQKQQFKNHNQTTKATNQINKLELSSINLENLIPSIYLKENFKLENLETFKEILNDDNDNDNNKLLLIDKNNLTSDNQLIKQKIKELEKKLTEHLAKQISIRFRDFFHIMNAMELVMDQLNTTIKEVTLVRKNCSRLQETLVYPSLKNIQLTKKKATLQSVYEKIRIMSTVHETQPTIQNFLSTYDYVGALDLITATQEVYDQDLNGLMSFRHLNSQLSEIKKVIIQMMKEDFVKFLTQEWNRPFTKLELELNKYSTVNDSLNFNRIDNYNFDKEKLSCMIIGMLKVKHHEFVETFKDEASTTIEASIKQTVIECLSNIEDAFIFKSNLPFDQLNELDYYRWLKILNQIFNNLYIVLKRIQTIHIVVGRTISKFELLNSNNNSLQNEDEFNKNLNHDLNNEIQFNNNGNPFDSSDDQNEQNENHNESNDNNKSELINKLDKCLFKICQFSHRKCSDIIISKMKDNYFISKVSFDEYSELVKLTEKFTSSNQSICSENIPQLKLALRTQTNKYVTKFHDNHEKSILSLLEIEQWKPFEQINPEFQQIINDIIEYNCSFNEIHKSRKQQSNKIKTSSSSSNSIQYLKYLEINGEKFIIVYTIISFIHIIIEYCSIAAEIKSIAPDLLTRLVALFKNFNSKVVKLG